jgi:hypothetical protein
LSFFPISSGLAASPGFVPIALLNIRLARGGPRAEDQASKQEIESMSLSRSERIRLQDSTRC